MLNGEPLGNNSVVSIFDIGEGDSALLCKTSRKNCCHIPPNRLGEFFYPNGVMVPIKRALQTFYRNRGEQEVRLNRREGFSSPSTGTYHCEIPDANGVTQRLFIQLVWTKKKSAKENCCYRKLVYEKLIFACMHFGVTDRLLLIVFKY